jgi:hypoxanthine phosphoribosyltransferase
MADDAPFPGARLVVPAAEVASAWVRLAAGLQPVVAREPCTLLGVLMGGVVPLVRVAAGLRGDFLMDTCHLTRYRGATAGADLQWQQRPRLALRARTVILVDDIFDEGHTLTELRRFCHAEGARRVLVAVLARKRHEREVRGPPPEFVGLEVPDEYVFGCGMDYRERWRHLDAIWALPGGAPAGGAP